MAKSFVEKSIVEKHYIHASLTGLNQVQPVSEYLFPVFVKFQGLSDIFLIKLKLIGL